MLCGYVEDAGFLLYLFISSDCFPQHRSDTVIAIIDGFTVDP